VYVNKYDADTPGLIKDYDLLSSIFIYKDTTYLDIKFSFETTFGLLKHPVDRSNESVSRKGANCNAFAASD